MPPRSLRPKTQLNKTTSKPSSKSAVKSEVESAPNPQKSPQSSAPPDAVVKHQQSPRRSRELFDLNEPWGEEADEVVGSKEEIVMKVSEDDVKEEGESESKAREEVPKPVKEKRKQKEYEIFVGGLHRDAVEEDLNEVFRKVGEIVEVRLVKSKHSSKNKGFAFVRFATVEQAKKAASELNFTQIRGKLCEVTRNNDNETLHLRNICTTWTKEKLEEKLRPYELENLEEVHLIDDPNDKTKNRGYAFLNFSTHMDAVAACNRLQKEDLYFGTHIRAEVAFAKSAIEPDEEVMAQVKSVFLDGLPPSWDEEQVQEQFKKYGEIENVQLARNMPSAKRKDFGFISFRTREAALDCIDALNKDGIGEGAQKVLLKATLRKPLQKRIPSAVGGWRGYSNKSHDGWGLRSHPSHSCSIRPSRTVGSVGWDHEHRLGGFSRYSAREAYGREFSPGEKYASQFRRGSVRRVPAVAISRSRDSYHESSSSSRHSFGNYEDFTSHPQDVRVSCVQAPHGRYEDDDYYSQYDCCDENCSEDGYEYPPPPRLKRPYSAIDDGSMVSRSLTRHARIGRSGLEMDAYQGRDASMYEEYSRSTSDDHCGYYSPSYANRQLYRSNAPRAYRY